MERLIWHLSDELSHRYFVHVVAPQDAATHAPERVTVSEAKLHPLWRFLASASTQGILKALQVHPKIVLAGSGLTAPIAWIAAKISKAKAVAYVHGLDIVVPHRIYRLLWIPFLRRMDFIIANSHATAQLAIEAGISNNQIAIIPPGVSIPDKNTIENLKSAKQIFQKKYDIDQGPLLLSVGRLAARKGMMEFVRDVLPLVALQLPSIQLAIIGDTPQHSLHSDIQTKQQIMQAAKESGMEQHIHFLGFISDLEKSTAYMAADIHVFPIRYIENDPEGFGMVAIEAAAYGLPTIAYATGGVVDAVSDGVSGKLIPPENSQLFAKSVVDMINTPLPPHQIRQFSKHFSWNHFGERIGDLFTQKPETKET